MARRRSGSRRWASGCALAASLAVPAADAHAQADPVLSGTVWVGDTLMSSGTVVLHRIAPEDQAELDSLALGSDGAFAFTLPAAPDHDAGHMYFTSVRHQGVLYFGPAVTRVEELDSAYEIHAYDTIVAPAEGASLALQSRSVFFEPDTVGWRVTDLFQVRNDRDRTVVTRPNGLVWSHPLPAEAYAVTTGEGELSMGAASYEGGALVVRAALPPGERLFVVRYRVDDLAVEIPSRGPVGAVDVLVREPSPPVEIPGLDLSDRIELEAGSTYRRFTGADVTLPALTLVRTGEQGRPRAEWAALALALVLGFGGLWILRARGSTMPEPVAVREEPAADRDALLWQIARLDEEFEALGSPSQLERARYARRRAELLRRVRSLS